MAHLDFSRGSGTNEWTVVLNDSCLRYLSVKRNLETGVDQGILIKESNMPANRVAAYLAPLYERFAVCMPKKIPHNCAGLFQKRMLCNWIEANAGPDYSSSSPSSEDLVSAKASLPASPERSVCLESPQEAAST